MKASWVDDLKDIMSAIHSTDHVTKPYLTEAPWLIVVFKQPYGVDETNQNKKTEDHYYVPESVGIACGLLVAAIHNANLVTLTSTPMGAILRVTRRCCKPSGVRLSSDACRWPGHAGPATQP